MLGIKGKIQYVSGSRSHVRPLGVYIHIPFCLRKCNYCDFYSITEGKNRYGEYEKALMAQIASSRHTLSAYMADTVFYGGGTPTLFGASRLIRVHKRLCTTIRVEDGAEVTFETNPATINLSDYRKLRKNGFNRVSIGVQSFNDRELEILGRLHDAKQATEAVQNAKRAGFSNISIDLMYGIPGQTVESMEESLKRAIEIAPQHISFYGLKIEPGTPFDKDKDKLLLPDDDMQADMYLAGAKLLEEAGFKQYEVSNFTQNGMLCRHNMKYWLTSEYAGFGPGAHSYLGERRFSYAKDLDAYIKNAGSSEGAPIDSSEDIDADGQLREYIMLSLRLASGINKKVFEARFNHDFKNLERGFASLGKAGLAEPTSMGWRLTSNGFLVSNQIIGRMLDVVFSH